MESKSKVLDDFLTKLPKFSTWNSTDQVDYLAYFLTAVDGYESITATDIDKLIYVLDLNPYPRLSAYLSENASKNGKYVKKTKGYRLKRFVYDEIDNKIKNEPERIQVSEGLQKLTDIVEDPVELSYLHELLNCYKIQAYRTSVVMMWILTIYHLNKHIYENRLAEFNNALQKNPDKYLKTILEFKDFNDLKESKIIEVARSANVITNDLRKILDEKLGIRNSAAHPSGTEITGHKATEFLLDLLKHVIHGL